MAKVFLTDPAAVVVADLLDGIAQVEEGDGGWPGADVVDTVIAWLERLGLEVGERTAAQLAEEVRTH